MSRLSRLRRDEPDWFVTTDSFSDKTRYPESVILRLVFPHEVDFMSFRGGYFTPAKRRSERRSRERSAFVWRSWIAIRNTFVKLYSKTIAASISVQPLFPSTEKNREGAFSIYFLQSNTEELGYQFFRISASDKVRNIDILPKFY